MHEPVRHPPLIRLADTLHGHLEARGTHLLQLEPAALKDHACRRTGLDDFGAPRFEEGLSVLCESAESDANLNLFGRVMLRQWVLSSLEHRLRRVELRKTAPEIFAQPLHHPVIVLGLPRSGTTHLHRLLAQGPDVRALLAWEIRDPLVGEGLDLRRLRTSAALRHIRRAAPGLDAKHLIDANKAEECVFLSQDTFESQCFWMFFPVYGYVQWLVEQDPAPAYAAYREYLQIFQAQTPGKRLVLKAPAHAGYLGALADAVPEATIVHTHRDPVPVVGSVNSLYHTLFSLVTRDLDHAKMGRVNLDLLAWSMEQSMAARARIAPGRLLDVRYPELTADPVGTLTRVCGQTGLDFDADELQRRVDSRPQHRFGRHTYSLDETGLSEAGVRERFAAYREQFALE